MTQRVAHRLNRYLPLILWMAFISLASTTAFSGENTSRFVRPLVLWLFPQTSEGTLATIHFIVRKTAHFTEYALMGFFAARAFASSSRTILRQYWFSLALVLIAVYALFDEYHQSFVASRTPSLYDSMLDIAGGLAALMVYEWRRNQP